MAAAAAAAGAAVAVAAAGATATEGLEGWRRQSERQMLCRWWRLVVLAAV